MNSEIKIFKHPELGCIRATEQNGEPWFVAKDIAERLWRISKAELMAQMGVMMR